MKEGDSPSLPLCQASVCWIPEPVDGPSQLILESPKWSPLPTELRREHADTSSLSFCCQLSHEFVTHTLVDPLIPREEALSTPGREARASSSGSQGYYRPSASRLSYQDHFGGRKTFWLLLASPSVTVGELRALFNLLTWQHLLWQNQNGHLRCVFKSLTLRETVLGKALGYPEVTPIWNKNTIFTDACGLPNYILESPRKPLVLTGTMRAA